MRIRSLAIFASGCIAVAGGADAYDNVFVFGDSLSDDGNTSARTFGFSPGGNPYWQGRFSNGPVWTEHLATALGAELENYAYGGGQAASGQTLYVEGFLAINIPNTGYDTGAHDGSQYYLFTDDMATASPPTADLSNDLVVIGGGAVNYFGQGETTAAPPVGAIIQLVSDLYDLGAREFMVSNLPDLGVTPDGLDETSGPLSADLSSYTMAFNTELLLQLGALQSGGAFSGISIYHLDAYTFMNNVIDNPATYGFTNVTDPAYTPTNGAPIDPNDPYYDDFVFFDDQHPTAYAHELLGGVAAALIPEPSVAGLAVLAGLVFSLRRRKGSPSHRCPMRIRRYSSGVVLFSVSLLVATRLPQQSGAGEIRSSAAPSFAEGKTFPWQDGGEGAELVRRLRRDGEAPVMRESLDLRECLVVALEYNRRRPASRFQVEIAAAMHRQALAGYFPHFALQAGSNLRSDDISFVFPETQFLLPATTLTTPKMSLAIPNTTFETGPLNFTVPANSLGPGFPAADLHVPVGSQKIPVKGQTFELAPQQFTVPSQSFSIPEQEIQVWDRVTHTALIDVKWLLLDGGWRRSLRNQAKGGIAVAKSDARRTDLDIVHDVTKYYKGAVLARSAEHEATEVMRRMQATLDLTKELYEGGSLKVTRLDYTKGKSALDTFKVGFHALVEARKLADAALVHSMGLSWKSDITPRDSELEFEPLGDELEELVADTYRYSPDWKKVQAGIAVFQARVKEQKSKMRPRLALFGNAQSVHNELDSGFANDSNLNSWNIGIGVEVPLFRGGLERARVREAEARLHELEQRKAQVRQKIAWGVKSLYHRIETLEDRVAAAEVAEASAQENRELHDRAYMNDLAEAEDVFAAQVDEARAIIVRLHSEFEHASSRAKLDSVVGRDVMELLGLDLYASRK